MLFLHCRQIIKRNRHLFPNVVSALAVYLSYLLVYTLLFVSLFNETEPLSHSNERENPFRVFNEDRVDLFVGHAFLPHLRHGNFRDVAESTAAVGLLHELETDIMGDEDLL